LTHRWISSSARRPGSRRATSSPGPQACHAGLASVMSAASGPRLARMAEVPRIRTFSRTAGPGGVAAGRRSARDGLVAPAGETRPGASASHGAPGRTRTCDPLLRRGRRGAGVARACVSCAERPCRGRHGAAPRTARRPQTAPDGPDETPAPPRSWGARRPSEPACDGGRRSATRRSSRGRRARSWPGRHSRARRRSPRARASAPAAAPRPPRSGSAPGPPESSCLLRPAGAAACGGSSRGSRPKPRRAHSPK